MFKDYTLQTTLPQVAVAVAVGAVGGAIAVVFYMSLSAYIKDGIEVMGPEIPFILAVLIISFIVWALGLVIVGCPVWFLLHKYGYRTRLNALVTGFTFPFSVGFWLAPEIFDETSNKLLAAIGNSVLLGLSGSFVALIVWRIAYRRPPPC